jgi:hypothetical protein
LLTDEDNYTLITKKVNWLDAARMQEGIVGQAVDTY